MRNGYEIRRGWTARNRTPLGGNITMTENERREQDTLTRDDIVLRVIAAASMIATFLMVLLVINP